MLEANPTAAVGEVTYFPSIELLAVEIPSIFVVASALAQVLMVALK
jgi:hypothetical protein